MFAASLTCQTLALRPVARTPGRFLPCGTQSLPPPELQDRRVESGTEEGRVATGPEPREVYIGGTGRPGRQLRVHLPHRCPTTLAGNSIAPTSARCSRAFAPQHPPAAAGFPAATLRPLAIWPPPSCWRREEPSAHACSAIAGVPRPCEEGTPAQPRWPLRFGHGLVLHARFRIVPSAQPTGILQTPNACYVPGLALMMEGLMKCGSSPKGAPDLVKKTEMSE